MKRLVFLYPFGISHMVVCLSYIRLRKVFHVPLTFAGVDTLSRYVDLIKQALAPSGGTYI